MELSMKVVKYSCSSKSKHFTCMDKYTTGKSAAWQCGRQIDDISYTHTHTTLQTLCEPVRFDEKYAKVPSTL